MCVSTDFVVQARLVVTLTTLLVLYTLFNSTSSALPDTAYIKMIDIWFLYCILMLFVIITVHVVVEHLEKAGAGSAVFPVVKVKSQATYSTTPGSRAVMRPDRIIRIMRTYVIPSSTIVFNMTFWGILIFSSR